MEELELMEEETSGLSRRDMLVRGGLIAAGGVLLSPAAAFARGTTTRAATAGKIKVAVVTHGDTGSFWSVFKKGVDQAASNLKASGVSVTQVYANNDVSKQVAGINAAIAAKVNVIATSVPDASALKDPLTTASKKGIEIITVNSGLGAFDSLPTYEVHVGQTEQLAGAGAGKQFNGRREEPRGRDPRGVELGPEPAGRGREAGVQGQDKTLVIPNAKSDLPGTKEKIAAYFRANKGTDAFLGLDPDVTAAALDALPKGTKAGTFDLSRPIISEIARGQGAVRGRPAAVPAGLPAGDLRLPLRQQPEHGRERQPRAHRPRLRHQEQRVQGRCPRQEGDALAAGRGRAARRRPPVRPAAAMAQDQQPQLPARRAPRAGRRRHAAAEAA